MSEQPEELIRAAMKDGCRAHCDSLIHELRRQHEEITALRAAVVAVRFQCEADSKAGEWTTPISKVLELIDVMKGDKV
jgi:hypothetical protein